MMSTRVDACGSALRGRFRRRLSRPGFGTRGTERVDSLVATALKYFERAFNFNDHFRHTPRPLQALEAHLRRPDRHALDGRTRGCGFVAGLQAEDELVRPGGRHR